MRIQEDGAPVTMSIINCTCDTAWSHQPPVNLSWSAISGRPAVPPRLLSFGRKLHKGISMSGRAGSWPLSPAAACQDRVTQHRAGHQGACLHGHSRLLPRGLKGSREQQRHCGELPASEQVCSGLPRSCELSAPPGPAVCSSPLGLEPRLSSRPLCRGTLTLRPSFRGDGKQPMRPNGSRLDL